VHYQRDTIASVSSTNVGILVVANTLSAVSVPLPSGAAGWLGEASALDAESLAKAVDQLGEAPGLLGGGEVATRKLGGLDRIAEPLPSQAQLACLESVLAAADDVETH
jgi:hypothetical protein